MKLVRRILCQEHIQGYIAEDSSGAMTPLLYNDIVAGIKDGSLRIENAKVVKGRYGIETLRGIGCKLQELSPVRIDADDPFIYRTVHMQCHDCENNGKPICEECMANDDCRGYDGKMHIL